jgi:IclR family KDG regulon transcriptional repressor
MLEPMTGPSAAKPERKPYLFQSVERALRLLEIVGREPQPRNVRELSAISGFERTMTYRLLSTLASRGFVERDLATDTWSLGLTATSLSNPAAHHAALVRRARPELERLAREVGQTVSVSVSQHGAGVVIDQVDPPNPIRLVNNVNVPLPLHCTSNGKILLARMSAEELEAFLREPMERRTDRTITSPDRLQAELQRVRRNGYAAAVDELAEGVTGLSVAVDDPQGKLLAVISFSGPTWQIPRKDFRRLAAVLDEAAAKIVADVA